MDGLYFDTFGMPPIDDLSSNSAISQTTPDAYCTYPNKPAPCSEHKGKRSNSRLYRTLENFHNRQENGTESSETNRSASALELAVLRGTRAAQLSPLSSEKEDDSRRTTLMQDSENEEKLVEEPHIVDEPWRCCSTTDCWCNYCPCNYDLSDDSPHGTRYDAGFDRNCRSFCNCCSYCCEGRSCLQPSENDNDDGDDDDVIEIEFGFGHILGLVKLGWASATDWAKQIYIKAIMAVGSGQHRDDEVD
ncbi:hypothetical protein F4680DRAFT_448922 [Xylaria scruposa]|nr:hypothetical protein F4680DRAFT_448922 [Xylaria scruposa]